MTQPWSTIDYVELHCHSSFSLLDGASTPEALIARFQQNRALMELAATVKYQRSPAGSVIELEAGSISGTYDLLVKCNLQTDADVGRFVTGRLQTLPNVKDTLTIITFNAFT